MGAQPQELHCLRHKGRDLAGRRTEGMNQWKSAHAVKTDLPHAGRGDGGRGTSSSASSVKGAVTQEMVQSMADNPVIFAMANPDPEITPEEAHEVRVDAIVATGRSDYPNQGQQCPWFSVSVSWCTRYPRSRHQ